LQTSNPHSERTTTRPRPRHPDKEVEAELVRMANLAVADGEVHIGPILRQRAKEYEEKLCA
tara:strand:- start:264 stop:446 length:183 start_codon:yes stop_codon:yes gene_type:complete